MNAVRHSTLKQRTANQWKFVTRMEVLEKRDGGRTDSMAMHALEDCGVARLAGLLVPGSGGPPPVPVREAPGKRGKLIPCRCGADGEMPDPLRHTTTIYNPAELGPAARTGTGLQI